MFHLCTAPDYKQLCVRPGFYLGERKSKDASIDVIENVIFRPSEELKFSLGAPKFLAG